ncbi:MAG: glutathione S-transferase N-terminal domain-containing protein [Gammaproteobacteria bacterium]|nr:glutathione S-transferase N-terminal domain-containing protein [Gammaproteobacteria bacterium]
MIDLYTWSTPNGQKASIMLEETGLAYEVHPVNIGEDEQFEAEFVAVSPNSKIPAIVDDGLSIFESGAILIHLAEKTGQFLAADGPARAKALEWLMFQMAGLGPMLGQTNHFLNTAPEKIPYAIERFLAESARLLKVLDDRLAEVEYLAGDYSIADIACYPWTAVGLPPLKGAKPDVLGDAEHITRWLAEIASREAVIKGMAVP